MREKEKGKNKGEEGNKERKEGWMLVKQGK